MNEENLKLIAYEINRLRGAIVGLCMVIIICTISVFLAIWMPDLIIFILIFLGIALIVSLVGGYIGLGLGKSIKYFQNR